MKKLCLFILMITLLCIFCPVASAEALMQNGFDAVTDAAALLTEQELSEIQQRARQISEEYRFGVYIVTVPDYYAYGYDPFDAAINIYQDNNLGYGEQRDGILLLVSMDDRDYYMIVHGYGDKAFTNYGQDVVISDFLDELQSDNYYQAFQQYLSKCDSLLALAKAGTPLDASNDPAVQRGGIFLSIAIGVVAACIVMGVLKGKMKSVQVESDALSYIPQDGGEITVRQDVYTHTTQTRRKVEKSSGGSSHRGGFSGKGGKF